MNTLIFASFQCVELDDKYTYNTVTNITSIYMQLTKAFSLTISSKIIVEVCGCNHFTCWRLA